MAALLHTALNGRSPIDRVCDLLSKTPLSEDVYAAFEPTKERIRDQNYVMAQKLHELKSSIRTPQLIRSACNRFLG